MQNYSKNQNFTSKNNKILIYNQPQKVEPNNRITDLISLKQATKSNEKTKQT